MLGSNTHWFYGKTQGQAGLASGLLIQLTRSGKSPLLPVFLQQSIQGPGRGYQQEESLEMSALRGHALHLLTYDLIFLFLSTHK